MKCTNGHENMTPNRAQTVSGMGQKPRKIKIRYICERCHQIKDVVREEDRLTPEERAIWNKKSM